MKSSLHLFASLFILSFILSCKKEEPIVPVVIDPIVIVDSSYTQYGSPFTQVPANDDVVMYEVNLRAFSNQGNLQGVISRLDNIKALGVNVIWLMPIYPIGAINSVNSPYSISDYKAVNPEFGTLDDLRQLTDAAHQKGMAVILDWVANHTAWDHPWINDHKDWYTQNANGEIIIPAGTNWADVADLNFDNADMRLAMIDAMKYWALEANVDGFRCDYADGVPADFWTQAIDSLKQINGRTFKLLAEGARSDLFASGFDFTYGWNFYSTLKNVYGGQSAEYIFGVNINEYNSTPSGKHRLRFTTNHDESAWDNSPMTLFNGKAGATAASVITAYMGGVPLIYNGQEVGRATTTPFFTKSPINWAANADMRTSYEALFSYYAQSDIAKKGTLTKYANADVVAFKKTYNGNSLYVIVNARDAATSFTLPSNLQFATVTDVLNQTQVTFADTLLLSNYQYIIFME